jgi:hypothetical protein
LSYLSRIHGLTVPPVYWVLLSCLLRPFGEEHARGRQHSLFAIHYLEAPLSKSPRPSPRQRTALHLGGNHARLAAFLDFPSSFAMQYALTWVARQGYLKVPSSVIARRALVHYAQHLEALRDTTALTEWRLIEQAAKGGKVASTIIESPPEPDAQQAALDRLGACADLQPDLPLPPFLEALHGAVHVAAVAARNAAIDSTVAAHIQTIADSRYGRLLGLASLCSKPTTTNSTPTP